MDELGFRAFLQQRSLKESSIDTYITDARRVEAHYGDFDELYKKSGLAEAVQAKVPGISERNRSSYGTAVRHYRDFRDSRAAARDSVADVDDGGRAQLIGLERELQAALAIIFTSLSRAWSSSTAVSNAMLRRTSLT